MPQAKLISAKEVANGIKITFLTNLCLRKDII